VIRLTASRPVQRLRLVLMPPHAATPRLEAGNAFLERLDQHRWAIVLPQVPKGESELRVGF
jgi:hypothetical protein